MNGYYLLQYNNYYKQLLLFRINNFDETPESECRARMYQTSYLFIDSYTIFYFRHSHMHIFLSIILFTFMVDSNLIASDGISTSFTSSLITYSYVYYLYWNTQNPGFTESQRIAPILLYIFMLFIIMMKLCCFQHHQITITIIRYQDCIAYDWSCVYPLVIVFLDGTKGISSSIFDYSYYQISTRYVDSRGTTRRYRTIRLYTYSFATYSRLFSALALLLNTKLYSYCYQYT